MDKITATSNAVAYGASGGSLSYSVYHLFESVPADAWPIIGVVGSLAFAGLTCISNIAIKIWAIKRGYRLPDDEE